MYFKKMPLSVRQIPIGAEQPVNLTNQGMHRVYHVLLPL